MDFAAIPLFGLMKQKLDYASERQALLASNIANADTPGYKAKDVQTPDFQAMMTGGGSSQGKLKMAVTDSKHMTVSGGSEGVFKIQNRATTAEQNPDGNNVTIEDEMQKVAENQSDYQTTLNLYRKMVGMFKTALGTAGS